jgi:hypothetical protein
MGFLAMHLPQIAFGTPRKLPNPARLGKRVVVLDVAFAGVTGHGFEKITEKFLSALGERLAVWVDHHDHDRHQDFADDARFVLSTKAEHGACPEMITPELVRRIGAIDCIVCHNDFDGLMSAAKWVLEGDEPYEGADADARAIDTRMGKPSAVGLLIDRALRARPTSDEFYRTVIRYFVSRLQDKEAHSEIVVAEGELRPVEIETERAARSYRVYPSRIGKETAYIDVGRGFGRLDKTDLLLRGQKMARVSVVVDEQNVSIAAAFDSGLNFLELFGLAGGMPTRVSLPRSELDRVLERLGVDFV